MQLFDTHCHIHESAVRIANDNDATRSRWAKIGYPDPDDLIADAAEHDVTRLMLVGCSLADSQRAVALAGRHDMVWASIGIHPHEAEEHLRQPGALQEFAALASSGNVKAIGECGLDFYYNHSPKDAQIKVLRFQLELALEHNLPVIFHVRDAFDEFWPILDEFKGVRGVIHSFTSTTQVLEQIVKRGLYVGINGIITFTKVPEQLAMAKAIPLEKLVLETDAPFLTPAPYRGTICLPKHVRTTAEFMADLRGESLTAIAGSTTRNARMLFDV